MQSLKRKPGFNVFLKPAHPFTFEAFETKIPFQFSSLENDAVDTTNPSLNGQKLRKDTMFAAAVLSMWVGHIMHAQRQRPPARAAFARVRAGRFVRPRPLPAARMSVRNASFTAAEFLNFLCTSGSMTTTLLLSR